MRFDPPLTLVLGAEGTCNAVGGGGGGGATGGGPSTLVVDS